MEKIQNKDYQQSTSHSQNIEIVLDKTICKGDKMTTRDQFGVSPLWSWQPDSPGLHLKQPHQK